MTHHTMNQMGDEFPNLIGIRTEGLDQKIRKLVPGYMTMGNEGMAEMGEMAMKVARNSIPMLGAEGPFDYITMGGLFTVLKIREGLTSYEDPGWYQHPPGTVATLATAEELKRDGLNIQPVQPAAAPRRTAPADPWCQLPLKTPPPA